MATEGSIAGRELFDAMNVDYEHAYRHNPFKKACINKALSFLGWSAKVLDVGCGTGVPVSQILSEGGMEVHGIDIAPKMIELARSRVPKGNFAVADMLEYEPTDAFDGVFIVYSHLQLDYASFHKAAFKFAQALKPGGILVVGQSPCDCRVPHDTPAYDETKSYVEKYELLYWGKPTPTFMMSHAGQLNFLRSMGLEILYDTVDDFQPDNPLAGLERQQYVIAQRVNNEPLHPPLPPPR